MFVIELEDGSSLSCENAEAPVAGADGVAKTSDQLSMLPTCGIKKEIINDREVERLVIFMGVIATGPYTLLPYKYSALVI